MALAVAITRAVSDGLAECELTHRPRDPINVAKAVAEHACYEEALRSLGATVVHAPPEPTLPDAVFVEDTALALLEHAVSAVDGPLCADVADHAPRLQRWLLQHGFVVQRPFTRMVRGAGRAPGNERLVYLVAGPELG